MTSISVQKHKSDFVPSFAGTFCSNLKYDKFDICDVNICLSSCVEAKINLLLLY